MKFRTDINALRAFAVLVVVFYHFDVPGFRGGFAGVDIFFVISGFLMTGIIIGRLEVQQFSATRFYIDRAFRILPALSVLCITVLAAGWFFMASAEYMALGKHVASALTFVSNHIFRSEAGYFDASSHEKWLLHTWSLSVECQFYLFYPLAILMAAKLSGIGKVRWFILAGTVCSFMLSMYVTQVSPSAAFYLLPTRAWEMMAGGLVYCFPIRSPKICRVLVPFGTLLLLLTVFCFDASASWPGSFALVPVLGAGFIILSGRSDYRVFSNRPTQFIGKVSYSVYLWHWPVVVLLNHTDRLDRPCWVVCGIGLSLLLGYLSYQFIEARKQSSSTRWFSCRKLDLKMFPIFAISIVIAAIGLILFRVEGVPGSVRPVNMEEKNVFLAKYERLHKEGIQRAYREECDFYDWRLNKAKSFIDPSCTSMQVHVPLFLWGDSHAQALSAGLRHIYSGKDNVAQVATSVCRPSLTRQARASGVDNNCDLSNQYALTEIARLKPKIVVLAQQAAHENTDWNAIATRLLDSGAAKVVLIGPMPNWRPSLPVVFVRRYWDSTAMRIAQGLDPALFTTDRLLQEKYGDSKKLTYISLTKKLCNQNGCIGVISREKSLIVLDYGHLTPWGSVYVAEVVIGPSMLGQTLKAEF